MRPCSALLTLLLASAPAAAAELYRWVDEKGVVNYSNTPPPRTGSGKPASVVEDRISIYTPEKAVSEALAREKDTRPAPPPATQFSGEDDRNRRASTIAPPPPPPAPYDPCLRPGDPHCTHGLYDHSPVFHGRRRAPVLQQPQLPPGTIAGQAAGPNAAIPGQSAARALPPQQRQPEASFTVREPERERRRR